MLLVVAVVVMVRGRLTETVVGACGGGDNGLPLRLPECLDESDESDESGESGE